jgi:glycosyltransferase involved in cell wall biosynthesis
MGRSVLFPVYPGSFLLEVRVSPINAMKVLHIVPTFYPATYFGGPIFSLYGLCNALSKLHDIELRVLTTDNAGPESKRIKAEPFPVRFPGGYSVYYFKYLFGVSVSASMLLRMPSMIHWADVVHITSVYSFPTIPALFLCRLLRKPVVWSPRGALQQWEGSTKPLLKKAWESVCNALLDKNRCVLHATSEQEAEEGGQKIAKAYVEIIKNGINIPGENPAREWMPDGKLRLLFMGRLHPKKGIENLLHAMKELNGEYALTICGTGDDNYRLALEQMANNLGMTGSVYFAGHVEGDIKSKIFWNSDVCIVPSYTENFAMVVAEALAHSVPVIAGRGTPWPQLAERQCGLWVENDPLSLAKAITDIRSKDLCRMGLNGRRWIEEEFSWAIAAGDMFNAYRRLVNASHN